MIGASPFVSLQRARAQTASLHR